jgi:hypothetical protein
MHQSNITFQNRKLTVDYITFNLRNGTSQIQEIANIFNADYSFDCYLVNQEHKNPPKQPFLVNNKSHQLVFVLNSSEHKARTVLIQFSGENAAHLYNLLKSGEFYWPDFDHFDLVLGRFDINYIREQQVIDDLVFQDFGERCVQKYKARYPQAITEPLLTTGFGLGTRKGDYFLRIYKPDDNSFLKFELEIKKAKARNYHNYFLNLNQTFLQFENLIATRFYQYLKVALVLDTQLTDWLLSILRKTKKPLHSLVSNPISTTYKIEETSIVEQKKFYRILQFLSFSRRFSYYEEIFQGETFQSFSFPLVEFTKNIGLDNNYHNRQEVVRFFHSLRGLSLDQWFSDDEFQSIAAFPIVTVRREQPRNKRTKLIVKVSVLKDFFSTWKYAFYFPKTFYLYDDADDRRVKLQFIGSLAGEVTIRKEFCLSYFLSTLNSISNQRKTAIKKNIIKQFQILEKEALIKPEITLYQKDDNRQTVTIQELSLSQINKTKIIGFYETNKSFREQ